MAMKCGRCGDWFPSFMQCPKCQARREVGRDGVSDEYRKKVLEEISKPALFAGRDFDDI